MIWVTDIGAIAMAIGGVLAYRGVWRSWAFRPLGFGLGFMLLYIAVAYWAIRVAGPLLAGGVKLLAAVFLFIGIGSMILAMVSMIWLPKFLLPTWFRTVRGR